MPRTMKRVTAVRDVPALRCRSRAGSQSAVVPKPEKTRKGDRPVSITLRLLLVAIAVAMLASAAQGVTQDDAAAAGPVCAGTCD